MIEIGRLRELAETRVNASPWNVAALRILDEELYDHQERYTPVVGPRFYANAKQSLSRPDVVRHRRRVMQRYRPAEHKKVLLLIAPVRTHHVDQVSSRPVGLESQPVTVGRENGSYIVICPPRWFPAEIPFESARNAYPDNGAPAD